MTRAALYARYSSDSQSEASIEDQFRLCREHARRERWPIVGSYADAAISGASTILRPGIQRLMRDAQHGELMGIVGVAAEEGRPPAIPFMSAVEASPRNHLNRAPVRIAKRRLSRGGLVRSRLERGGGSMDLLSGNAEPVVLM